MRYFTIKSVSKSTEIPPHTLRFWEREFIGILKPSRSKGGQRRYSADDISVIQHIKQLKEQGDSLSEIKEKLLCETIKPDFKTGHIDLLSEKLAEIVKFEVHRILNTMMETSYVDDK